MADLNAGLGVGFNYQPLWNTQVGYDQGGNPFQGGGGGGASGGYSQNLAGMLGSADPFSLNAAQSQNTMAGLGQTIGNAFGGVNSLNVATDQANQNRALKAQMLGMLGNLLGSYRNGSGPGSIQFHDTKSGQSAG